MLQKDKIDNAEILKQLGFVDFGKWSIDELSDCLFYQIEHKDKELEEAPNALYAFTKGKEVLYIGKTTRGIKKRFVGYIKPGKRQATNIKCHQNIKKYLLLNNEIRVLLFIPMTQLQYGNFEINLAAGLEDALIAEISPSWNFKKGSRAKSDDFKRELEEEMETAQEKTDGEHRSSSENFPSNQPYKKFSIELQETYYQQGIINPGKAMNPYLGEHGEPLIIYLGDTSDPVTSKINKIANRSGAVRIVGNNRMIARWFQENFSPGDTVKAIILDKNHILLESPRY